MTTISEPDQEKDSDPQFPKSSCSPFPNKIRSKHVAGSGTVEQGLKKCAAAVCHGAVVLKNKGIYVITRQTIIIGSEPELCCWHGVV